MPLEDFWIFAIFGWIQISNFWMDILTRAGREWGGLFSEAYSEPCQTSKIEHFALRFLKGLWVCLCSLLKDLQFNNSYTKESELLYNHLNLDVALKRGFLLVIERAMIWEIYQKMSFILSWIWIFKSTLMFRDFSANKNFMYEPFLVRS